MADMNKPKRGQRTATHRSTAAPVKAKPKKKAKKMTYK